MSAGATAADRVRRFIDPHHHLWNRGGEKYLIDEFSADLHSFKSPHATVYMECLNHHLPDGEAALRCTGETAFVAGLAAELAAAGTHNLLNGFVAYGDLALGEDLGRVLDAHAAIAGERFKGVRYCVAWDSDDRIHSAYPTVAGMLAHKSVAAGVAQLQRRGLSLDIWAYFTQLDELAEFMQRHPGMDVILNHCGGPIGVGRYAGRREEVFGHWCQGMERLAVHDGLTVKFGGMAMAVAGFGWHRLATRPDAAALATAWRPYFDVCMDLFGPGRMMFESNFPVDRRGCDYGTMWRAFAQLADGLADADIDALFYGNAARVYRL